MLLMIVVLIGLIWSTPAVAVEAILPEVVVTAKQDQPLADELPAVQGTKIYSGKKTSRIDLQQKPTLINNNYRQALDQTPGLLVSEESSPLVSIGYRGLPPDRVQYTQVLKDGIPITADMYGYPEAYYFPPTQVISHMEFVRGGAGLLYGPQPGGALNIVTKEPSLEGPVTLVEENAGGSHGLYSNYTALTGTTKNLGYYSYFHHRQSQGFRDHNSQSSVYYGGTKLVWDRLAQERWDFSFDIYNEKHGEPGGLSRADFDDNSGKATRMNDHFEQNRYAGALSLDKEIDESKALSWKTFGGYYERLSWRQRGGSFGVLPTGGTSSTNDIQEQAFLTGGTEVRVKNTYDMLGFSDHVLTAGALYFHSTSPRQDKRGVTADAEEGEARQKSLRTMNAASLFMENMFKFDRLSLTPGVRLENIWQSVKEKENVDKTTVPLGDEHVYDFVPLVGLGAQYEVNPQVAVYSNISQSYRPKTFTQAVPTGSGQTANGDLEEAKGWQVDFGVRGKPSDFYSWDVSYFYMRLNDQIGTSGTTVDNAGDAVYQGLEFVNQVNAGDFNFFGNITVLEGHFAAGSNKGKTPQYAPDFIFKTGVEYNYNDQMKLKLSGTFLDDHFANDTNTTQYLVPSYKVWDLTTDVNVYKNIKIFGGINNLFDEHYFSRVTSTGIDPADGRNYYGGLKFIW